MVHIGTQICSMRRPEIGRARWVSSHRKRESERERERECEKQRIADQSTERETSCCVELERVLKYVGPVIAMQYRHSSCSLTAQSGV